MWIAKSEDSRVIEILYFQMDFRVHKKNINKHKIRWALSYEKDIRRSNF